MSLRMQLRRIVKFKVILTHDYWICGTLVSTEFIRVKSTKLFLKEFTVICVHVHAWETNTHARVNLFEMSTYNSSWSWSVSQFSTWMNLLRNGFQRNSWWNSQTDSQMHTFRDQINWQCVQILMASKFQSKLRVLRTQMTESKRPLCFLIRENRLGCCSFVLRHLCPIHKINAQTLMNVKCRMDWSCRKPYICLLFNFWKQYSANGTCSALVNMHKYVTSLWLLWKSAIFPDLHWNSLTC